MQATGSESRQTAKHEGPGAEADTRARVLLIEDEEAIADPLAAVLRREGFQVLVADTAAGGLNGFRVGSPDVVLLDVMLPDGDGRDVLREIRRESSVPVLMVTARDQPVDRVVGLELGADDYIVKPFDTPELVARIRAVLRRVPTERGPARSAPGSATAAGEKSGGGSAGQGPPEEAGDILRLGELEMNLGTRTVTVAGRALDLALKEFEVLRMLLERPGKVVRRGELMDEVWDPNWFGSDKTLDVHISSLRKKLGDDAAEPRYIHTVRGVGFRSSTPEEAA